MAYNGYANYETWCVALWMDNDQGEQEYWNDRAVDRFADSAPAYDWETQESVAARELADELKNYHAENMPEVCGVYFDLLRAALDEVDWQEIATNYIDAVDKDPVV